MADLRSQVEEQIRSTHVLLFSKTTCPFCARVSVREEVGLVVSVVAGCSARRDVI